MVVLPFHGWTRSLKDVRNCILHNGASSSKLGVGRLGIMINKLLKDGLGTAVTGMGPNICLPFISKKVLDKDSVQIFLFGKEYSSLSLLYVEHRVGQGHPGGPGHVLWLQAEGVM
jgi:hypothetical protein